MKSLAPWCLLASLLTTAAHGDVVDYYHVDAIGNVRAVTDQSGRVVERHDYLPFGEEWCGAAPCAAPTPGQPRRFTGQERDVETGLDYFGARHYGSKIGRFTTVDPVYTWRENLVDPQRWNRYTHGRNNPCRYVDPTGRYLELAGDGQDFAFSLLQRTVGTEGAELLYTKPVGGRLLVLYRGRDKRALAATGQLGKLLADIIDSPHLVELRMVSSSAIVATRHESRRSLGQFGGGVTIGSEESLKGITEVLLAPDAGALASEAGRTLLMRNKSSDKEPLSYTNVGVLVHELGHALANLKGAPTESAATAEAGVLWENVWRQLERLPNRRTAH